MEFEPCSSSFIEPLMGWTGSSDTKQQVRMQFPSRIEAIAFARKHGLIYDLFEPKERLVVPKS